MEQPRKADTTGTIVARGLHRDFGDRVALRDVGFNLGGGETLAVLGPNGAGKTTLLRVLATLLRPSAGDVEVLGCRLPSEAWRLRGRVGYLGHEPLLYRELSGRENLRFNARLHGLDDEGADRINELLAGVKMERRASEPVARLSAGMVQRLAVCRAVLHDPELLLLDEPLAHLDPEGVALIEPLIGASGAAERRTRVLVTHDAAAGARQGDRILALGHGGAVVYEGTAREFDPEWLAAIYAGAPA